MQTSKFVEQPLKEGIVDAVKQGLVTAQATVAAWPLQRIFNVVMVLLVAGMVTVAPAYAQTNELDSLAVAIRQILVQVIIIGSPVAYLLGFGMIWAGGFSPQWKQRGIEVIKWTTIGIIGIGILAGAMWTLLESNVPLDGGGGGAGQ